MPRAEFTQKIYEATPKKLLSMADLLSMTVVLGASDLHLASGRPPRFRLGSNILPYNLAADLKEAGKKHEVFALVPEDTTRKLLYCLFEGEDERMLGANKRLDLSVSTDKARFRVNVGFGEGGLDATFRVIPYNIREAYKLGFPNDTWRKIIEEKQGLILVTGVTNSGKSTTLASLLQEIGRKRYVKIITVEDPIEYAFRDDKAMFIQRELGRDTLSFADAVKYSLRQNPDILMVGEIRDQETVQQTIVAAQTGHLVFSTLHTSNAIGSIERLVDLFPEGRKGEIRHSLTDNLKYVLSQELVPYDKAVEDRVLAMEIMVVTNPIRNLIREGKTEQLRSYIQSGFREGSITMEAHLGLLYKDEKVSEEAAMHYARDRQDMKRIIEQAKKERERH